MHNDIGLQHDSFVLNVHRNNMTKTNDQRPSVQKQWIEFVYQEAEKRKKQYTSSKYLPQKRPIE